MRDLNLRSGVQVVVCLVLVLVAGCQKAVEPERVDPDTRFTFIPVADSLVVAHTGYLDFQVQTSPQVPLNVDWSVDESPWASGPRFRFFPSQTGEVQIQAHAEYEDRQDDHLWRVLVFEDQGNGVGFLPSGSTLNLVQGDAQEFSVQSPGSTTFNYSWYLGGQAVGQESNYLFNAAEVGTDTVGVTVQTSVAEISYQWSVQVVSFWTTIHYSPVTPTVSLVETQERDFQVLGVTQDMEVAWDLNGTTVGQDLVYHYTAGGQESDLLTVTVTAFGESVQRVWEIQVDPLGTHPPDEVPVLQVSYGQGAGQVVVYWSAVDHGVFPLREYQVRVSNSGTIDQGNWVEATALGSVLHVDGMDLYQQVFGAEDGVLTGFETWFAIRAEDEAGQLSPLGSNLSFFILDPWYVDGSVTDDCHEPLAGITILAPANNLQATTDVEGRFRIGPFTPQADVTLQAEAPNSGSGGVSWYDYFGLTVPYEGTHSDDFVLLTRYGSDPSCAANEGDFLNYFMHMTKTSLTTPLRPDHRLYCWADYPLDVYVPDHVNAAGLDLKQEVLWALELWNVQLGEDYFIESASEEGAELVFLFSNDNPGANGQTILLEPHDLPYALGDVPPEKMSVYVNSDLGTGQRVRETALHELGHTLGLYRHALCNDPGYLMYFTAAGVLDNGPQNAIHVDELRAVRAIRNLPQGYDMEGFVQPVGSR